MKFELVTQHPRNRQEWFFNREPTGTKIEFILSIVADFQGSLQCQWYLLR